MEMTEYSIEVRDSNTGDILTQSRLPLCASMYERMGEAARLHRKLTAAEQDTYVVERYAVGDLYSDVAERKYSSSDVMGMFKKA